MLFRLYIGANNTTKKVEQTKAVKVISAKFAGFTISKSSGYWQGQAEKSITVDIETDNEKQVKELAKELCEVLQQQAVGVAQIGKMEFIS